MNTLITKDQTKQAYLESIQIKSEYRPDEMKAYTYEGKFCIASLDFSNDEFEKHDDMNDAAASYYYDLMVREYKDYNNFLKNE